MTSSIGTPLASNATRLLMLGSGELGKEVVIEAHRLLKNTISSNSYLLLTDSLLHAAGSSAEATHHSSRICEVYGSLRNICFTYYDLYPEQQVACLPHSKAAANSLAKSSSFVPSITGEPISIKCDCTAPLLIAAPISA